MKSITRLSLVLLVASAQMYAIDISNEQMREASKKMTAEEMRNTETHLRARVQDAKNAGDQDLVDQLESLFQSFYKGRYDLVMEELKSLGDDPQKILKTTGLREKMLSGELERTPWFIREVAGLDWFFEQDAKKARPQWPKPLDKAQYLIGLADQLDRNHTRASTEDVDDATLSVAMRLQELKGQVSRVFQRQIDMALNKLDAVRIARELSSIL